MSGGVLLSRRASPAVPSALKGLTSGFGMGPGVSPSLWPPKLYGGVAADPVDSAVARTSGTAQWTRVLPVQASQCCLKDSAALRTVCVSQVSRPVSTGQLRALQRFHFRPINPVVCWGPYQVDPEGEFI